MPTCANCGRKVLKCRCGANCPVWLHSDTSEAYCTSRVDGNRAEVEKAADDTHSEAGAVSTPQPDPHQLAETLRKVFRGWSVSATVNGEDGSAAFISSDAQLAYAVQIINSWARAGGSETSGAAQKGEK